MMGRTVPSFRMALEDEIERWKGFRDALPNEKAREAFDEMMDMCRNNAMASGSACNPIIFEAMVMSILLFQQQRIRQIEEKMARLQQPIYDQIWEEIKENG